jgi:uncharacterized membrane protein YoaK (UPF0700 family)
MRMPSPTRSILATVRDAASSRVEVPAALLSFIAAFVDTCVFIGLFGLFTAHVTGNFVLIGAQLVTHEGNLLTKLLALPEFIVAVGCAVLLTRLLKRHHRNALPVLLTVETLLLLMTVAAAHALKPPSSGDDSSTVVIGMLASFAMGLQNALMRLELSFMPPSTVMTVTVTQTVIDAVNLIVDRSPSESRTLTSTRFKRTLPSIGAFFLGAAGGAYGYFVCGFFSLLLPAALCVLLVCIFRVTQPDGRGV